MPLVEEVLFPADTGSAMLGRVFGDRYEVQALIGRGGMGWVFRARHLVIEQVVAVKVMRKALAQDLAAVKRFYQEARACSRLRHHNTIKVFDFGLSDDGHPYIVMEYLEGRPLSSVLETLTALGAGRAARITRQICKSLHEAHELGLVHRDLKPANIFLTDMLGEPDYVKVLDFGTAKFVEGPAEQGLTMTGIVVGTPTYMSPEQIRGRRVDRRSDVYSLGIVLFEMLTGRAPFRAGTTAEMLAKQLHEVPPPIVSVLPPGASVPPGLAKLVDRMLTKDPELRPATTIDVIALLDAAVPPSAAVPATQPPPAPEDDSATIVMPSRRPLAGAPDIRALASSAPSLPSGVALPSAAVRAPTGALPTGADPPSADTVAAPAGPRVTLALPPAEPQRVPTSPLAARPRTDDAVDTIRESSKRARRVQIAQRETAPADRPRGTLKLPSGRAAAGAWWALPAVLVVAAVVIVLFAWPSAEPPATSGARVVGGPPGGGGGGAPDVTRAGASAGSAAAEVPAIPVAIAPAAPAARPGVDTGAGAALDGGPTPAAAPTAARVKVEVESDPAHAEVWEGDTRLGATPLTLHAAPDTRRSLELRLSGHDPLRATVTFERSETYWLVLQPTAGTAEAGDEPASPDPKPRHRPKRHRPRPKASEVPARPGEEPKPEPSSEPKPILFD
jgi:serine/threonine-protein kinase